MATSDLVRVSRAGVDDARDIALLDSAMSRPGSHRGEGRGRPRTPRPETEWRDALVLATGDHRPWVAHCGDQLVGFVTAGPSRDADASSRTGEFYAIDIDDVCTDRGGGRQLINHILHDLREHGYLEATAWVDDYDEHVRRLLEMSGWAIDRTERVETADGHAMRELRYRRSLG